MAFQRAQSYQVTELPFELRWSDLQIPLVVSTLSIAAYQSKFLIFVSDIVHLIKHLYIILLYNLRML